MEKTVLLYALPEQVFGACAAGVLYRRSMLEEIGFLDNDFFLYGEDVDLSFRAQIAGWSVSTFPRQLFITNSTRPRES